MATGQGDVRSYDEKKALKRVPPLGLKNIADKASLPLMKKADTYEYAKRDTSVVDPVALENRARKARNQAKGL